MMNQKILVANNFVALPSVKETVIGEQEITLVSTIVSNLAYYGYIPSMEVLEKLKKLSKADLATFWRDVEPAIKELTGASKNMDKFVVYKNFPKEVLNKTQAEYWMAQILMYWGVPNEFFTEEAEERKPMLDKLKLKVLALAPVNVFSHIFSSLKGNASRWSDMQKEHAQYLVEALKVKVVDVDEFSFKENGILLANQMITKVYQQEQKPKSAMFEAMQKKGIVKKSINLEEEINVKLSNATDVLRLAAAMSGGDVSLRENVRFKKFKRSERRFLLSLLEGTKNIVEDFTLRADLWKKLLACLHPGDYKFEKVQKAYDIIYRDAYVTFNGDIDARLKNKDNSVLKLLESRPGEFVRKLHQMYNEFGMDAVYSFVKVIPNLKTIQLLKLDSYVMTINNRTQLIYPPKGNWTKAQFAFNKKSFSAEAVSVLHAEISKEIGSRLNKEFPQGIDLDFEVDNIKLQTNDQKLANYGRGTVFSIPENMKFIRSASYWAHKRGYGNTWFDNGWNFYNENWESMFTCCWDRTDTHNKGAVFSGDPTNSKDMEGRACQMIDLYLDQLKAAGVRYAVWNILCFSGVPFDQADVMGTLQWGEDPEAGKLFEPSRAQMVFPITGQNLTKYLAYIDVVERKLVYMDANFAGTTQSASRNAKGLEAKMPAFVEYLKSLPSVADLFSHAQKGSMPVWFSDENKSIEEDAQAFVFKPLNAGNKFTQVDLAKVLD